MTIHLDNRANAARRTPFLDSIRTFGAFMVVGIHTMGYVPLGNSDRALVSFLVHAVAVPIFFLVDGVIFAKQSNETGRLDYGFYVLKSARRLLVPWVVFSVLYVALRALFEYAGFLSEKVVVGSSAPDILKSIYSSKISNQMYFLLSLFFIRLFASVWYRLGIIPRWLVLLIWVGYTFLSSLFYFQISQYFSAGLDPLLHAIMGLRYYLLGVVVFRYHWAIKRYSIWMISLMLMLVIFFVSFAYRGILVQIPYLLCLYTAFLCFCNQENFLYKMGRFTMGIYLLHIPIILKGLSLIASQVSQGGLISFMMVLVKDFLSPFP